jgi:carboxypeptidase C (cathepsin A)
MKHPLLNRTLALGIFCALAARLFAASETNEASKTDSKAEAEEKPKYFEEPRPSITSHTISVAGKTLKYRATAGYIVLKEEEGKPLIKKPPEQKPPPEENKPETKSESEPTKTKDGLKAKAKIFYIAYVRDDGDTSTRPITFCFNGGPGSSSVWLHMAANAPRRANLTEEGEAPPPPYGLVDNESTWLSLHR